MTGLVLLQRAVAVRNGSSRSAMGVWCGVVVGTASQHATASPTDFSSEYAIRETRGRQGWAVLGSAASQ